MPWTFTQCAKCCLNMGCGDPKVPPLELTAVADVTGSCPEAANNVLSVTVTNGGYTCEDVCAGSPTFCDCIFSWIIDDADRPSCVPYIDHIFLQCQDPAAGLELAEGCDHVRYHHGIWYAEIGITAASVAPGHRPGCFTDVDTGQLYCQKLNCTTCLFEFFPVSSIPTDPCADCGTACSPCYDCPSHNQRRCEAGMVCCGTGGCPPAPECADGAFHPCEGPCYPCPGQWVTTPTPLPQTCGNCSVDYTSRTYKFWAYACSASISIEGCNPTACPPDVKNYGDFYLNFNCTDDSLTFSCPGGMMLRLRRKLPPNRALIAEMVRRMPAERVAELLKGLEK
jgi:hypothetical protein